MWRSVTVAALLVAALAWAQPSQVGCGPAQASCGPAIVALSTVTIPASVGSDTNCVTNTAPGPTGNETGWIGDVAYGQTCPTGANGSGYDVTAISQYIAGAVPGTKFRCSVYDAGSPHTYVAAGCDTVEATLSGSPQTYVTLATTGSCHLAPGTRYWIACAPNDGSVGFGEVGTVCGACYRFTPAAYPPPWPTTLPGGSTVGASMASYLTAIATSGTTTTTSTTTTTTLVSVLIPTAVGADTNCPTTPPVQNANNASGWTSYVLFGQTCTVGANAHGYDVTAISVWVVAATAGGHAKCSVYDTALNHVAAGCDSVEATLAANPNAYVTMATTGACHLAASVRYWITCATDSGTTAWGTNSAAPTHYQGGVSYLTLWPSTIASSATNPGIIAQYLTATPTP